MKKLLITILVFVFALSGCKKTDNDVLETAEMTTRETTEPPTTAPEYHIEAENFPISCYDEISRTCIKFESITYEWTRLITGYKALEIHLKGEKVYGERGVSKIYYTLKDSEGYIAYSGYCFSDSLKVGDKFKNMSILITDIEIDNYTLELDDGFPD